MDGFGDSFYTNTPVKITRHNKVSYYGVKAQCHMIFLSVDDRSVSVQVVFDQLDAETGLRLECGYHFVRHHDVYVT